MSAEAEERKLHRRESLGVWVVAGVVATGLFGFALFYGKVHSDAWLNPIWLLMPALLIGDTLAFMGDPLGWWTTLFLNWILLVLVIRLGFGLALRALE
jgi:hypothetical protein